MKIRHRSTARSASWLVRGVSLAVLGLAGLSTPAMATTTAAPIKPQVSYGSAAHAETVDQRISAMRAALKITPAEESAWQNVADVMRRNDGAMRKLAADRRAQSAGRLSAVDDLKTYEAFNQAHLDGLKDLISSFETLYASMPEAQKANADLVMVRFGHAKHHARSAA